MTQVFAALLASGIVLICAEIFVPGGVLGTFGGLALLGAMVTAYLAFGPLAGTAVAGGIVLLAGLVLALWIRLFPRSRMGRQMAVTRDLSDSKATDDALPALAGKEGVAASDLRPGGFATIEGQRVDVATRGEMIARGERIRVVQVEGFRVVVAAARPGAPTA